MLERSIGASPLSASALASPTETGKTPMMAQDEEIASYIKKRLGENVTVPEIITELTHAGWETNKVSSLIARFAQVPGVSVNMAKEIVPQAARQEVGQGTFAAWLKEDWLMKLGGFLLLIGFGWLVTYAFTHDWIGPMGRITMGIMAGVLILLLGEWRVRVFKNQGAFFLALGAGVILLTIFAARVMYGFFTPTIALIAMFLTVVFVALSSVRHGSKSLAALSLVLGFVVPILVHSNVFNFIGLFSYLFMVSLGTLWIVYLTRWNELTFGALIGVIIYSVSVAGGLRGVGLIDGVTVFNTPFLFSLAFGVLFFIASLAGALKRSNENQTDIFTGAVTGIFAWGWIILSIPHGWQSLIAVFWALVFSIGAFTAYSVTKNTRPFFVYGTVAAAFIGIATALELDGPSLAIAGTLEVTSVIFLVAFLTGSLSAAQKTILLTLIPIFLALPSLVSSAWRTGIFHQDFIVLFLLAGMFFFLGSYFYARRSESTEHQELSNSSTAYMFVSGSITLMVLLWLSLHALYSKNIAVTLSLAVYTVSGIILYTKGLTQKSKVLQFSGQLLMGLVVLRLLLIDVWNLDIVGKIIAFFSVGILLISTAFLKRKKSKG